MKKVLFLTIISVLCLAGCIPTAPTPETNQNLNQEPEETDRVATDEQEPENVQLANPASVHCLENDGELEMREEEGGTAGYCLFEDGSECEEWAFFRDECRPEIGIPEALKFDEESMKTVAEVWIENNAPTYVYDGYNLKHKQTNALRCDGCFEFIYEFQSRQAGYGNRTDQVLAQVITPHTIKIVVETGMITSAITDEKYDELNKELLD